MKWHVAVVLTCISLMTNDVEHFFIYLSIISETEKKDFIYFEREEEGGRKRGRETST